MTVKRLVAIMFIFVCTFIAWMILGAVNLARTDESYAALRNEVQSLYGSQLGITAPRLVKTLPILRTETVNGVQRTFEDGVETIPLELIVQNVKVDLKLDQRKKGTLWFPTFKAWFSAHYVFDIPEAYRNDTLYLYSPLSSADSIYSDIDIRLDRTPVADIAPLVRNNPLPVAPAGRKSIALDVRYRCTGMEQVTYYITPDSESISRIRNLSLEFATDFDDFDFLPGTLSPTSKTHGPDGHLLSWQLRNSVTGKDVGVVIPNRLNPGEILSRVTFFAPVPLLFFFFIVMMVSLIRKIAIHPMHYFFLAATFFSFHLIFSYYSDHMNIYLAFAIAALISLLLTSTYLRLFTPPLFAFLIAPFAQLIYLVVFSFSFFFKGTTGFIGATFAVLTLAAMMQLTGRMNWEQVFEKKKS